MEGVSEDDELRQSGLAQLDDGTQKTGDQFLALSARFVFLQQQIAKPLFEAVDEVQGGALGQVGQQPDLLLGFEVVAVAAHQRDQAAVLGPGRIDLSPAGQEVVVDEADHMEAVGDDDRPRKLFMDDRAVDYGQIHADDPDLLFAFEPKKIRLQGGFRAAEREVVNAVVLQIAESGGVALLAREEVLIDAQNPGTNRRMILTSLPLKVAEKVALHGRGADALASAQATPVDAIQGLLIDHLLETLTGSLTGLHARQLLPE